MVPWVGMQCVIVVFPDHTHLLFVIEKKLHRHFKKALMRRLVLAFGGRTKLPPHCLIFHAAAHIQYMFF